MGFAPSRRPTALPPRRDDELEPHEEELVSVERRLARSYARLRDDTASLLAFLSTLPPHERLTARLVLSRELGAEGTALAETALGPLGLPRTTPRLFRDGGGEPDDSGGQVKEAVARRGGGAPLAEELRRAFEAELGADLSRVRIHADAVAAEAARALGARAFTVGEDVYFAAGAFAPEDAAGRALLAHELTHVVQFLEGRAGGAGISQPGDPLEREAESAAARHHESPRHVGTDKIDPATDKIDPGTDKIQRAEGISDDDRRIREQQRQHFDEHVLGHGGVGPFERVYAGLEGPRESGSLPPPHTQLGLRLVRMLDAVREALTEGRPYRPQTVARQLDELTGLLSRFPPDKPRPPLPELERARAPLGPAPKL
jgi:hypothetical protein